MEDYIFSHSLVVGNVGQVPTFNARGVQTCIDITLLLNLSPLLLENLKVSCEATFSDHRQVHLNLTLMTDRASVVPDLKKANWNKFREALDKLFSGTLFT